ncbi:MAG: kdpD 1 [Ilumatobacteraceae bacterium]|nr:kdpD 1 [Ilumatobacteraceae bacterium]
MPARRLPSSLVGASVGLGGVALVLAATIAVRDHIPTSVPAMLLLIPIVGSSVVADWRVAVPIAVVAAVAYALVFLPPFGSMRVTLSEDVFVLITFVVVASVVGTLKGPRRRRPDERLVEGRALLLRGVSHDLRSPLTTIRTISSELRDGADRFDPDTRDLLLGRVVDESDRLQRIVGNLLSVSRVDAGSLVPSLEPEPIGPILRRCTARLDRGGAHPLVVDVAADLPEVLADAVQIDQVVSNLVENALRHAPPGSAIAVRAQLVGDRVEVSVVDDGPGFSPAARATLFRPSTTNQPRSAGLGLTVCKAIVEAHGGTIAVRDGGSCSGTTVAFTLRVSDRCALHPPRRG